MADFSALQNPAALARCIETNYHARCREQVPLLVQMAEQVEALHFGDGHLAEGLFDRLHRIIGEIEVHTKKDEMILFPAICRITGRLVLSKGAFATSVALDAGLDEFMTDPEDQVPRERS